MRTVLFWDVGSTFDTDCPTKTTTNCDGIKTDNLASSVGVGLTWITALGPLSFSLATPIRSRTTRKPRSSSSPWARPSDLYVVPSNETMLCAGVHRA